MARPGRKKRSFEPEQPIERPTGDAPPPPPVPAEVKEVSEEEIHDDDLLPMKRFFRVDEVATYFSVTERCIRLWIEHGHLKSEKIVGSIRITRESILLCRFRKTN